MISIGDLNVFFYIPFKFLFAHAILVERPEAFLEFFHR